MKLLRGTLWILIGLFVAYIAGEPSLVYAAEIQVGDEIPLQRTDWHTTMSVPQFDPSVGVLQTVKIQLAGTLRGQARFESLDAKPTIIVVQMGATIELQRPDGSILVLAAPETIRPTAVAAFDGQIDFGGPSGRTLNDLVHTDESNTFVFTDDNTLALFIGSGTVALPTRSIGGAEATGAGNLAVGFQTSAGAAVTVTYQYAIPAIDVEKLTNSQDADRPPGPTVRPGDPVTWTYLITNTGAVDLLDLTLLDDQEGNVTFACPARTLTVGSSMRCTVRGTARLGPYANNAVVTGKTAPDAAGNQTTVTDSDPSHYVGIGTPAIDLEKFTNGVDADKVPGPYVQEGAAVTWTYVITNVGTLDLVNLQLFDDQLGDIAAACADRSLPVGMSTQCTVTGIAHRGQYTNTAIVTGTTAPTAWPPGLSVTDSDPSHYFAGELPRCPGDATKPLLLPDLRFLGEGPGSYSLPAGYDRLIVKKHGPFRFEVTRNSPYVSTRPVSLHPERVWACAGACDFVPAYEQLLPLGVYPRGITLELVVIDDDNDQRINALVADRRVDQPVQEVTEQAMVEYLRFALPFTAEWSYHAKDSIGIVQMCAH
jgi:hypothetical protein